MKSDDILSYNLLRVREYSFKSSVARFDVETQDPLVLVTVILYKDGVVRYTMAPQNQTKDKINLVDPDFESEREKATLSEKDGTVALKTAKAEVEINLDPWKLEVCNTDGQSVIAELPFDLNARDKYLSLPTGYQVKNGKPDRCWINFNLESTEKLFGFGEKFTSLNKRGRRIVCWNENAYGAGSEKAYKNIPLLLSSRGYGLFLNETCRSIWDLGCSSNFSTSIEIDGPCFDIFILLGDSLKQLLARYCMLTGQPTLPPRWSFGLWISPYGTHLAGSNMNQESILKLAREIRKRRIPCEVIHLDPFWMGHKNLCSFEWDRQIFPRPEKMIEELKKQGFRVCLWEHPYIEKDTELYNEGVELGCFLKRQDGSVYNASLVCSEKSAESSESFYVPGGIVDFSNPVAVEWYKSKHRPLLEMGVAAFKSDFGEAIPEDSCFSNGMSGVEMHNVYPLLYNKTVYEVVGEFYERPIIWGRSGFAGIQKYPVQWSGDPLSDFKSLAATIRGGLSYGMSGVPFWTCDLGGFKGKPTEQVFVRWAQVGLLFSHSRFHGTTPRLPWAFGEKAFAIIKKFIHLRYRLLPYIYGSSLEAARTGVPVVRALSLEFDSEPGIFEQDSEYMLGSFVLVVPILNPEGEASIHLPKGDWYDYWSGEKIQGPVLINQSIKLDTLPIYIRSNAILPVAEQVEIVPELWDPLRFDIYPYAKGSFEIPEENNREDTKIMITEKKNLKTIKAHGPERDWRLSIHDVENPKGVEISAAAKNKWSYAASIKTVDISIGRCRELEIEIEAS